MDSNVMSLRRIKPAVDEKRSAEREEKKGALDACCDWILTTMNAGGVITSDTAVQAGHTKSTYYLARSRLKGMGALAKKHGVTKPASPRAARAAKTTTLAHTAQVQTPARVPDSADDSLSELFSRLRTEFGIMELHYKDGELEFRRKMKVS